MTAARCVALTICAFGIAPALAAPPRYSSCLASMLPRRRWAIPSMYGTERASS